MATSMSVGGLASGLDTNSIVENLMAAERQGRVRLQTRQATQQRALQVWQDLSSRLTSLRTAAEGLTTPGRSGASNITSSNDQLVGVSAGAGATPGTFTFRVKQLAVAHQVMATGFTSTAQLTGAGKAFVSAGMDGVGLGTMTSGAGLAAGRFEVEVRSVSGGSATVVFGGKTQTVASSGTITLTDDNGSSVTFNSAGLKTGKATLGVIDATASTTIGQFATAINNLSIGASAAAVDLGDGTATPVNFVVSARDPGTSNAVKIDVGGLSGISGSTFSDLRAAADAQLVLADGTTTVTRSSNRITDVLPGVTLDLRKADPAADVTVAVSRDTEKTATSVKSVVDALNGVISAIGRSTAFDATTRAAGPLVGDSRTRRVTDELREAMQHQDNSQQLRALSQIGISISTTGTYTFDQAKFTTALASDYAGTMRLLAGDGGSVKGAFSKIVDAVKELSSPQGVVSGAISSAQSNVRALTTDIERFDDRLALVEQRFRRQYTRLETTMSQLNSQLSGLRGAMNLGA